MSKTPQMLTIRQVCERLAISRWTLDRMRKRRELVPVRVGCRNVRYRAFDVERYEDRLRPVS